MRPYAQLMTMDDFLSFSLQPDGPWSEGEDGPVRPAHWVDPEADEPPPWTMTLVPDADNAFHHQGEKDELIQIAREAGVADENVKVFDRAARGYVPLT